MPGHAAGYRVCQHRRADAAAGADAAWVLQGSWPCEVCGALGKATIVACAHQCPPAVDAPSLVLIIPVPWRCTANYCQPCSATLPSCPAAVDAPSLALIIPVVHRGLRDRSGERLPTSQGSFFSSGRVLPGGCGAVHPHLHAQAMCRDVGPWGRSPPACLACTPVMNL